MSLILKNEWGRAMRLTGVLRSMQDYENAISDEATSSFDRRRSTRRALRLYANSSTCTSEDVRVLVRDVSPGGLMFETESAALSVNDCVEVGLPDAKTVTGRVVWTSGNLFGCEFNEPVSAVAVSAALLKAEPQNAENIPAAPVIGVHQSPRRRLGLGPELNFSESMAISIGIWGIIVTAAYFAARIIP